MLTFDADKHEYQHNGVTVPGVTQILTPLSNFDFVDDHVLQAAQKFGTAVHLACELDDLGQLDQNALDPNLLLYLEGWRKFSLERGVNWSKVEQRVYHPTLKYAGTLDRQGHVDGRLSIVDIKSGSALMPSVGPQLSAYAHAASPYAAAALTRLAVRLIPGGYELKKYTDPQDWPVFCSLLTVGRFCTKHRITPNYKGATHE